MTDIFLFVLCTFMYGTIFLMYIHFFISIKGNNDDVNRQDGLHK